MKTVGTQTSDDVVLSERAVKLKQAIDKVRQLQDEQTKTLELVSVTVWITLSVVTGAIVASLFCYVF